MQRVLFALALGIFYLMWRRPAGARLALLFLAALSGLGAFYLPYRQLFRLGSGY